MANAAHWGLRPMPADLVAEYQRQGLRSGLTVGELLPRMIRRWPWRPAVEQDGFGLSYLQVGQAVERTAGYLAARGVGRGEVVSWQLPNWWEAYVIALAIWQLGAISSPIVPIYREGELTGIFRELRPKAVVTCGQRRSTNHLDMFESALRAADVQPLARIAVRARAVGWACFEDLPEPGGTGSLAVGPVGDADDPCLILFTSGTISSAKGVVHTSASLLADVLQMSSARGFTWEDLSYMPAPLAHVTGMLIGLTVPLFNGGQVILDDGWEPQRASDLMRRRGVTFSAGSTLFVQELVAAAQASGTRFASLRNYACGGAAITRELVETAYESGIPAVRGYGMTELPTVTMGNRSLPWEDLLATDGPPGEGVEVKACDSSGAPLPQGQIGELLIRGPERMAGYLRPADSDAALDGEGWLHSGDLGFVADGRVTVTGRLKEIINRGGEKFSSREIEDALLTHDAVRAAAVVPAPDARFGEVPVAWLVVDWTVSADELTAHLASSGLARQKTPVYWRFVDSLPVTASGKVKRGDLIARLER